MPDLQACVDCEHMRTSNRDKLTGDPVCSACSNTRYFDQLKNGQRIELKIDLRVIREATVHKILALLKEDEQLYIQLKTATT